MNFYYHRIGTSEQIDITVDIFGKKIMFSLNMRLRNNPSIKLYMPKDWN